MLGPNRGKSDSKIEFSVFIQPVWGLFEKKNLITVYGVPFPIEKVIFIFVIRLHFPSKMVNHNNNCFFMVILENIVFCEKIVKWKIFKNSFPTKKVILILVAKRPLPSKTVICHKWFFVVFFEKLIFYFKNGQMRSQNSFLPFPQKIRHFTKKLFNMKIFSI